MDDPTPATPGPAPAKSWLGDMSDPSSLKRYAPVGGTIAAVAVSNPQLAMWGALAYAALSYAAQSFDKWCERQKPAVTQPAP